MLPAYITFSFDYFMLRMRRKQRQQERERQRRLWMHPIRSARMSHGVYFTLYLELRQHPDKFFDYFHMSVPSFDDLLQRVAPRIQRQDTRFRRSVSPTERLMLTLHYLATGESLASLHFQFRLGKSTMCCIVQDTCQALWDVLQVEVIPEPSTQQWNDAAETFWQETQFPNCVGAVDGKHIRIQKPQGSGSEFLNNKKYFSIILMAIADAKCRFIAVDIGAYGRSNGSRVFKDSFMGRRLYSGQLGLPAPQPFPGTEGPPMPFVLVGDEAYQMCDNLLKPYSSRALNYRKRIFNYRLSRARQRVECAFGILTAKWRIFARPIRLAPEGADEVVKACVVLHNYLLAREPLAIHPKKMDSTLDSLDSAGPRSTVAVKQMRHQCAEFFLSNAGWLDWQEHII